MNPFELSGPPFLLFFAALVAATTAAVAAYRRSSEAGDARVPLTDPYAIAYLRGGPNEALRVATVALVDRGLLLPSGETLTAGKHAQSGNAVEAAILDKFRPFGQAAAVFSDPAVVDATEPIKSSLQGLGLLPGPAQNAKRATAFFAGLAVVWGVAGERFIQALSHGRRNLGFLVVLAILSVVILAGAAFRRRTASGERLVQELRTLFSGLKDRAGSVRAHKGSAEVALLAAVFGVGLLPADDFGYIRTLYPKAASGGGSGSYSSGSSCGPSCGGGCGGGCGGCGG